MGFTTAAFIRFKVQAFGFLCSGLSSKVHVSVSEQHASAYGTYVPQLVPRGPTAAGTDPMRYP